MDWTNEQFADAELRNKWRNEKGMMVLNLWSEQRRETPIDVFVREPFDFTVEHGSAKLFSLAEGLSAPIVALSTLFKMKQEAGRPHDLNDIAELKKIDQLRDEK